MKALAEGRLELDSDAVRHLDLCLECRGCETACPSGVRYGQLIERARVYVDSNWRRGVIARLRNHIIGAIFPYPARLRAALAPLRFAERIGMRRLLRVLAPAWARDWLDLVPMLTRAQAPGSNAKPHLLPALLKGQKKEAAPCDGPSVVVHRGCVAQVLSESANLNSERALAAAGYRIVHLARTACCGALDIHHGNLERAREFARINVAELTASGADSVVCAASGCSAVIAQYGELLKDDSKLADPAREVSRRATDISSLLLARPSIIRAPFRAEVTYHDSCHLVHGLGVREQPRELLRSIPGVHLIELAESDLCCGSAGSYNLTERAMARELARRKVDNIIATGAQFVLLSNPGCEFQIAAELKRRGSPIRVMHMADFLALASTAPRRERST
jgi:glycolate oxidase iron-sulfur subunit